MRRTRNWLVLTVLLAILACSLLYVRNQAQDQANRDTAYTPPVRNEDRALPAEPASPRPAGGAPDAQKDANPTLTDLIDEARAIADHLRNNVSDYTATLVARERVKGQLKDESRMQLKIRNANPTTGSGLNAYLKFSQPAAARNREVIWQANQNDGKILVHEAGFRRLLGTLELRPEGPVAMMGQKYPITEIGLLRLAEKLIEKAEREAGRGANPPATIEVLENQAIDNIPCRLYQVTNHDQSGDSDFHIAQVFVDMKRMVPLKYAAYMWPEKSGEAPPLEEEYTYLDLKLNVGLSDLDFDPQNPAYDFP